LVAIHRKECQMLERPYRTLPAGWYYQPGQYRRELEAIWFDSWICVARASEWPAAGSYRVVRIGDQQIMITRDAAGRLHAFHNTCRHRGSLLCDSTSGQVRHNRIVCPYHAWAYSLEGQLLSAPGMQDIDGFDAQAHALYRVALETHAGFVFVNLADRPRNSLAAELGEEFSTLANWPLAELAVAHRETHTLDCNWKVFWENFQECYHCPGVHQDLCRLVPVYGAGVNSPDDLPADHPAKRAASRSMLRPGAVTWSMDGTSTLPWFAGLSAEQQAVGMTFATCLPSVFIVAHVDYVRSVQLLPLGPERTRLTIDWMLLPQTLASGKVDIEALTAFGRQVVLEDARVCALNQSGLHSRRHDHGVLAPQEYDVLAFDNWVLARLGEQQQD
jgi:Rieske 2Fe-2S family protein